MANKGLLVVSFGTSYHETREKTIDKLEQDLQAAFPEYSLYRAWTSKIIIKKVMKRDNIKINTVTEAMETMKAQGVKNLVVQPTHILSGIENDIMKEDVMAFAADFDSIAFGNPLLMYTEDFFDTIKAIMAEYGDLPKDEALVFMGHGTAHATNTVYAALDYMFKDLGYTNVFMGTVEAYPDFPTMLKMVKAFSPKKITLAPFMIVAGDHATNDMAGEDDDAWQNLLKKEGFGVECQLKGLGEYPKIRKIFVNHALNAVNIK